MGARDVSIGWDVYKNRDLLQTVTLLVDRRVKQLHQK